MHGAAAAAGLVTLIVAVTQGTATPRAMPALILFLIAAGGGFMLFFNHLKKTALPKGLVVIHALVAVAGFLILLTAVMSASP